jgi:peptidoglycan/LPS O-acetylase OafA/YrhL
MTVRSHPRPQRIPELDGLRGAACLLVLLYHYVFCRAHVTHGTVWAYLCATLRLTYTGVDLFFVLSGFLLGGILIEQRLAPNMLRVFYVRRACRLLPLYFAWLGLFVICRLLLSSWPASKWLFESSLPTWIYVPYLQNNWMASTGLWGANWLGVSWSLAVEEQFYVLLPAIVLFAPPRLLPFFATALVLVAPLFRAALLSRGWPPLSAYVLLPARWDGMFLGVLGAWLVRRPNWATNMARTRRRLYIALVAPTLGILWLTLRSPHIFSNTMLMWGYSVVDLFYFIIILLAVSGASWAFALRWRWLRWVGLVSYGVYLFHQATAGFVFLAIDGARPTLRSPRDFGLNAIAIVLTFVFAHLSYRYFESPILKLGHRARYDDWAAMTSRATAGATSEAIEVVRSG